MLKTKYLIFSFLLLVGQLVQAQNLEFLKAEGKVITNESGDTVLLRGMGLGGWMVQEGYMLQTSGFAGPQWEIREKIVELVGEEETQIFYDKWLENHVQKIDIDSMKAWGFNHLRVPLHYNLFTLPIQDEPLAGQNTWIEKGFELTDSLISWCRQNEMYIVLDLHAAPGGQGAAQEISDYNPALPSLWESNANKAKTVALWKRIAERYKDEPVIGAYDLLNEPNWDIPGGIALRNLYVDITNAIREVDNQHMIIIEGNWFANDFTGLSNPWDDNMAFGPHKYWSFNNPSDNDWLIKLRDDNNVPIYLGESGENSNVWYNDAIRLLESEGFSWAWWTQKKVESISGLWSMPKTQNYQILLNYWSGNGAEPSQEVAIQGLNSLAESAKFENCHYNRSVTDAMFRQVETSATIPWKELTVPGVVHASDYDLGRNGEAYYDLSTATYHVTTGNFEAWNNGWVYRNDGVDIERTEDNVNSNGFNVGWIEEGEWMKYSINVEQEGLYNVVTRVAGGASGGEFTLGINGADATHSYFVPVSGGYQNWQPVIVEDIMITSEDEYFTFKNLGTGYNLSSFEFIHIGDSDAVETFFSNAVTLNDSTISVDLSKPLVDPITANTSDFSVRINGNVIPVSSVMIDSENPRKMNVGIDFKMIFTHDIKISYSGNTIKAIDDTALQPFTLEDVENTLPSFHVIPGLIEAEDFSNQSGVVLEDSADDGGGQNIGFLDPDDFLEYEVLVQQSGFYTIDVRHASEVSSGAFELQLENEDGGSQTILNASFPSTGGWQNWETKSFTTQIPSGRYTMRMKITGTQFNINWLNFGAISSNEEIDNSQNFSIYPNPVNHTLSISQSTPIYTFMNIYSIDGALIWNQKISEKTKVKLDWLNPGIYTILLKNNAGQRSSKRFIKN